MRPKVYLMSGVSGGGKSTEAEKIAKYHGGMDYVYIFSADHFFIQPSGDYKFEPRLLPQAHAECLLKFTDIIFLRRNWERADCRAVIVDNTNLTVVEMAPYVALAMACGCEVEIVTVHCDPKVAASRNVHGVPPQAVERMDKTLRHRELPSFWRVTQRAVDTNPQSWLERVSTKFAGTQKS